MRASAFALACLCLGLAAPASAAPLNDTSRKRLQSFCEAGADGDQALKSCGLKGLTKWCAGLRAELQRFQGTNAAGTRALAEATQHAGICAGFKNPEAWGDASWRQGLAAKAWEKAQAAGIEAKVKRREKTGAYEGHATGKTSKAPLDFGQLRQACAEQRKRLAGLKRSPLFGALGSAQKQVVELRIIEAHKMVGQCEKAVGSKDPAAATIAYQAAKAIDRAYAVMAGKPDPRVKEQSLGDIQAKCNADRDRLARLPWAKIPAGDRPRIKRFADAGKKQVGLCYDWLKKENIYFAARAEKEADVQISMAEGDSCLGGTGQNCGKTKDRPKDLGFCVGGRCPISAGSWTHDICCAAYPHGRACGGSNFYDANDHDGHCVQEWNLATRRTALGHYWWRSVSYKANYSGKIAFNEYCASNGSIVHKEDAKYCCGRNAVPFKPTLHAKSALAQPTFTNPQLVGVVCGGTPAKGGSAGDVGGKRKR